MELNHHRIDEKPPESVAGSWRVEDASRNQFLFHEDFRFLEMGGFNERFIQLGGGFANFDFFRRAAEAAREGFVMLLGESMSTSSAKL